MTTSRLAALLPLALALLPPAAAAQCSSARAPELPGGGYQSNCDGGSNTGQLILFKRTFEVTATTSCRDNAWKTEEAGTQVLVGTAYGQCGTTGPGTPPLCEPAVGNPIDMGWQEETHTHWVRVQQSPANYNSATHLCEFPASTFADATPYSPGCLSEFCCQGNVISECNNAQGDFVPYNCECNFATPILLDVRGNGFALTSFGDRVLFDLASNGILRQMSWTAAGSDDAFLALDRNHNGIIDGGTELFGNYTPTPTGPKLNGFLALAVLDSNSDGRIDRRDPVFRDLELWTDANHNGRSEPLELVRLSDSGIESNSVEYRESRRQDQFGNAFRYRARVVGGGGPFAYDVMFLLSDPTAPMSRRRPPR